MSVFQHVLEFGGIIGIGKMASLVIAQTQMQAQAENGTMPTALDSIIANTPTAGAVILVVVLFLKHVRSMQRDAKEEREKSMDAFEKRDERLSNALENVAASNVRHSVAMEQNTAATRELSNKIK